MNKKEMIKEIRKVMSGQSRHTYGIAWNEGREWKVETSTNKVYPPNCPYIDFKYVGHRLSLKEAKEHFDDLFGVKHAEKEYYRSLKD